VTPLWVEVGGMRSPVLPLRQIEERRHGDVDTDPAKVP
jgi:hypothetical protein